jgi:hypothetical protein
MIMAPMLSVLCFKVCRAKEQIRDNFFLYFTYSSAEPQWLKDCCLCIAFKFAKVNLGSVCFSFILSNFSAEPQWLQA